MWGLGWGAWARGAWAWAGGPGPGGYGQTDVYRDGRTKYPLHSTEHRSFGAAAQKGSVERRALSIEKKSSLVFCPFGRDEKALR